MPHKPAICRLDIRKLSKYMPVALYLNNYCHYGRMECFSPMIPKPPDVVFHDFKTLSLLIKPIDCSLHWCRVPISCIFFGASSLRARA